MKVNLIKKQTIRNFSRKHASSDSSFETWFNIVENANWNQPVDVKNTFNSVDFIGKGSERVIFNVGGNDYRIICKYKFGKKSVHLFVIWIGTHAEYTELCSNNEQYTAENFRKFENK